MNDLKTNLLSALFFTASLMAFAQVGIGTTNPKAALDVVSANSGFLMPRVVDHTALIMSADQIGMQVYNTTTNSVWVYNGTIWEDLLDTSAIDAAIATNTATITTNAAAITTNTAAIATIAAGVTPVGTVITSFSISAPSGYLAADGSTFNAATYPELNTALGGNILPDLRGMFLRGKNNGRIDGLQDPDGERSLGNYQADVFKLHKHGIRQREV